MEPKPRKPDTQVVELIGRHYLIAELLHAGLEVATPVRDRGVDMIAYLDIDDRIKNFSSCPIQLKASTKRAFGLDRKYERIHNLLIVYVWHLADENRPFAYALTYSDAFNIATDMGWTETNSWKLDGRYVTTSPSARLISLLEAFKMSPEKWRSKVTGVIEAAELEEQKKAGWDLYNNESRVELRARGVKSIIEAHFSRNPEAPSFETYAGHWLWASEGQFDQEVLDVMIARYPLPANPRIKKGYSDWDSFGNPSYPL
ncbi:MAG: hypothetical protein EOP06_29230 [Proteobacteria bacterium]|nr:MAG: hypothetical protein EOP06_29230 [Pseudomonadota bacterium]